MRVSENRRFLVHPEGKPFFYLADTAWELFHRLNPEEAQLYLRDRANKGFTVIQAVILAELGGLVEPTPYGHVPLRDNDPARPVEEYFRHVDWIVDRAAALGLWVGMLPTWGDKWNKKWGSGPEIFTPKNARAYGEFLGRRYRDRPILWILGGDRPIEAERHTQITRALAAGLRQGDGGRGLISFHPNGGQSSGNWLHEEPWLDLNLCQSGHSRNQACYNDIARDWARRPVKPCLNAEPGYEHIPNNLQTGSELLTDHDARKFLYWSVFAGACGHTYGCNEVWQMWQPGRPAVLGAGLSWREALHLPGAGQMQHARRLLESRPFLTRVPDQTLLASDPGAAGPGVAGPGVAGEHVRATRDESGAYALIYLPTRKPVRVHLSRLSGREIAAHWYDPRDGSARPIGVFPKSGEREFTPPEAGPDWVLVLDDAARKYPTPGARKQ